MSDRKPRAMWFLTRNGEPILALPNFDAVKASRKRVRDMGKTIPAFKVERFLLTPTRKVQP